MSAAMWRAWVLVRCHDGTYRWRSLRRRYGRPGDAHLRGHRSMAEANLSHPRAQDEGHVLRYKVMQCR